MPVPPLPDTRAAALQALRETPHWDLIVIGGGATGLGTALDAAARGFKVALLESHDFAQGTSSRATKLVHGGVRYLAQGNIGLVREALHERATLLANAPHLAQPLQFVMPGYRLWELPFYGAGLKAYDLLAGRRGLGPTEFLSRTAALAALPNLKRNGLHGAVRYFDGQFDDARLAVALARSAQRAGAVVLNHVAVTGLVQTAGKVVGVQACDAQGGAVFTLASRCVVNATGVWVDRVRAFSASPGQAAPAPMLAPSQGTHLVVGREFLPGGQALMVPRTRDGRVLFGVPWMGKVILGTTDTPIPAVQREPRPLHEDIEFILGEAGRYLERAPQRSDVLSAWVGLRPLVRPDADSGSGSSQKISREHVVRSGRDGLVSVTGGKWTTYRAMAEDVLARCMDEGLLERRAGGVTAHLALVGAAPGRRLSEPPGEHLYGSEADVLRSLPGAANWLWRDGAGGLSEAMVRFAVRFEMARTVHDVLARRSRLLFLDAAAAQALAQPVAELVAQELDGPVRADQVASFNALAQSYRTLP